MIWHCLIMYKAKKYLRFKKAAISKKDIAALQF